MTQLTQTLLLICLIAAAMFSVVVFLISEKIKDVYRYASGKYKDHNDRQR